MELKTKSPRKKKGEERRGIHTHIKQVVLDANTEDEEQLLCRFFRMWMDVGVGGFNLAVNRTLAEIKEIKEKRAAEEGGRDE